MKLFIDVETFSSVDLTTSGAYKYFESIDFELLMVAYRLNIHGKTKLIDLALGEKLPKEFTDALQDKNVEKHSANANFERGAFKAYGFDIPANQWFCTLVKAAYCGLPLSLSSIGTALGLEPDKAKLSTGRAAIKYFCVPCIPTKKNGFRCRNFPHHDLIAWEEFKTYCIRDVDTEIEIDTQIEEYSLPQFERDNYLLDQKINDRGILIDCQFAANAISFDNKYSGMLMREVIDITGVNNPNSPKQLKTWLSKQLGVEVPSLAKDKLKLLIKNAKTDSVLRVLKCRKKLAKSSTKKYVSMENYACSDQRARGLFQFYGANRTGRWAGRGIQLQNLPKNYIDRIEDARDIVASGDYDLTRMLFDDVSDLLSQLIRTSLVASEHKTYGVADFSAIEARVISWLANETWRLDVFHTHGKIYEASAAMMFNVPIDSIDKGSDLRTKGKIAELALGYQGSFKALEKMGGAAMGLSVIEMKSIVNKWRKTNRAIVGLWYDSNECAMLAVSNPGVTVTSKHRLLKYYSDGFVLKIQLPSGRSLHYQEPRIVSNRFDKPGLEYRGMIQSTKQWGYIDTYGGKLVENIVQAIARDLLAYSMLELDKAGFDIVMHVHDEVICEIDIDNSNNKLQEMCDIMGQNVPWAQGLPLVADGYITPFYKKD